MPEWKRLPDSELEIMLIIWEARGQISTSDIMQRLKKKKSLQLVQNSLNRLEGKGFRGNTLTLKIKFHDFTQITRSITQGSELTTLAVILPLAKQLLREVDYEHHPIRLIGLSVSNPRGEEEEGKGRRSGQWEQLSFEFGDWE